MRILAVDTSSERILLSLGQVGDHLPEAGLAAVEKSHGPGLLGHLQALLEGRDPTSIDAIACGRGPGSFTGVRIALSFAKTFAWARRIPLFTFDVFGLHFELARPGGAVWVLEDARRGELYVAARTDGLPTFGPAVSTLEGVLRAAPQGTRFLGSGARLHGAALAAAFGGMAVASAGLLPDAGTLHRAALAQVAAGAPENPVTAEPLYLRASDAEVNLAAGRIRSSWHRVVSGPGTPEPPMEET